MIRAKRENGLVKGQVILFDETVFEMDEKLKFVYKTVLSDLLFSTNTNL